MNTPVFLDASLMLEAVLPNRALQRKAVSYLTLHEKVLSPLTSHILIHFGNKDGLDMGYFYKILENFTFTDFSKNEIMWATKNCKDSDFEDALQVGCAVIHGCEKFATLDKKLAKRYEKYIEMDLLS